MYNESTGFYKIIFDSLRLTYLLSIVPSLTFLLFVSGVHTVPNNLSSPRTGSPRLVPIQTSHQRLSNAPFPLAPTPHHSTAYRYFLKVFEEVDEGASRKRKEEGTARVW
jgi:hypothetical protein